MNVERGLWIGFFLEAVITNNPIGLGINDMRTGALYHYFFIAIFTFHVYRLENEKS